MPADRQPRDAAFDRESYDWREAFYYGGQPTRVPPLADVDNTPVTIDLIAEVVWIEEGYNDGPDWLIGGTLTDGRWFFLAAGCDYTGWDCRAGGNAYVAATRADIERFGMGDEDRRRLGVTLADEGERRKENAGW